MIAKNLVNIILQIATSLVAPSMMIRNESITITGQLLGVTLTSSLNCGTFIESKAQPAARKIHVEGAAVFYVTAVATIPSTS